MDRQFRRREIDRFATNAEKERKIWLSVFMEAIARNLHRVTSFKASADYQATGSELSFPNVGCFLITGISYSRIASFRWRQIESHATSPNQGHFKGGAREANASGPAQRGPFYVVSKFVYLIRLLNDMVLYK